MSDRPDDPVRRHLLQWGASLPMAAWALGAQAEAAADTADAAAAPRQPNPELLERFAELRGNVDGRPAFWLARGVEYASVDGRIVELQRRHIVAATAVRLRADGSAAAPYVEMAYSTQPGRRTPDAELISPLTQRPYPNPALAPIRLTVQVSSDGDLSQEVRRGAVAAHYRGRIALMDGIDGNTWVNETLHITVVRPNQTRTLAEIGPLRPLGPRRRGWTPVSRDVTVYRPLPPDIGGDLSGAMIGTHFSRRFRDPAELQKALLPEERAEFLPFFERWESMLAPADSP